MRNFRSALIAPIGLCLAVVPAWGAENEPRSDAPSLPSVDDEVRGGGGGSDPAVQALEEQVNELKEKLRQAEEDRKQNVSRLSINGYADVGFFAPFGGGVGWVRDVGNIQFPQLADVYTWTFLGDILATAVNSRGEVADLGDGPGITRFDSVDSNGASSFIANELNLRIGYAMTDRALLHTSVNFIPRSGRDFALGDFMEVDLAEMEYLLTSDGKTSIFVGKTLPVFGIEYKERKSDQRFGITPSLMARYTTGPQLGMKIRSKLFNDWVILAGSVTNNSSGTEQFHFYSEIDQNNGKTVNGRAAVNVPISDLLRTASSIRLEIGLSGEFGTQDWQRNLSSRDYIFLSDSSGRIWFQGVDLQLVAANFALKAQWMRGRAAGRPEDLAWGLVLRNSGYVEANWQVLPFFGLLGRFDVRDATVTLGTDRIYITKQMRATAGARVVFNPNMALKVEYLHNIEYGGIAEFTNNVATSSLVMSF